jgi:hypothetical protein
MRYRLGRVLQFLGLVILPIAILSELENQLGLGQSLMLAATGALVFYIGFVLQQSERAG